jgi:hypothetical protein
MWQRFAPGRARTANPVIRSHILYPIARQVTRNLRFFPAKMPVCKTDIDARFLTLRDVCGKIPAKKNRSQGYVDRIRLTVSCRCFQREEFGRKSLAENKTPKRLAPPGTTIGVKESLLNVDRARQKEASVKKKEPHKDYAWSRYPVRTGADDG